jgi:hypothetical protein
VNFMFEQHDETLFAWPVLVLSKGECSEDCPETHWFIGLSCFIWTVSIWK